LPFGFVDIGAPFSRFASLVVQLDGLTTIKPSMLVTADVDMARLKRVTAFLEAFIAQKAQHEKAARFAALHNETAEQSAEAMKAKHAANENAAAPAAAA